MVDKKAQQFSHEDHLGSHEQDVISNISEILKDVRNGIPVVIVDDEDRENEGDLVVAAQMATPENINFMAKYGRGLVCLPMEKKMINRLGLELVGRGDNIHHRTAFTVSIEAKEGVTTGISAADRAHTIQTAINPETGPLDIATPGHVFPLVAQEGGVLVRAGHTEAAVDLAQLAGFSAAGVICEIMNDDGSMARLPDLAPFARDHNLKIGTIADLIAYRRKNEKLVKKINETSFHSRFGGEFRLILFRAHITGTEHIALVKGDVENSEKPVLVRMHAINVLDDALGGHEYSPLQKAMEMIASEEKGVIVCIRESEKQTLSSMLEDEENNEQEQSGKIHDRPLRHYGVGAQILKELGVRQMRLITNAPKTVIGLDGYGLEITGYKQMEM